MGPNIDLIDLGDGVDLSNLMPLTKLLCGRHTRCTNSSWGSMISTLRVARTFPVARRRLLSAPGWGAIQ